MPTLKDFEKFLKLLPTKGDSDHSWTVSREAIETKNYDLKAVNPNAKTPEDIRTGYEDGHKDTLKLRLLQH